MCKKTEIPAEILNAYQRADYVIFTDPDFTFKIGQHSAALLQLLDKHNSASAAFITASNPYSQTLPESENRNRNQALLKDLKHLGLTIYQAEGQDPEHEWPSEGSYLLLGIGKSEAMELAQKYQQNAIVWCERDSAPELLLLR